VCGLGVGPGKRGGGGGRGGTVGAKIISLVKVRVQEATLVCIGRLLKTKPRRNAKPTPVTSSSPVCSLFHCKEYRMINQSLHILTTWAGRTAYTSVVPHTHDL
jgi:hypothetical protein